VRGKAPPEPQACRFYLHRFRAILETSKLAHHHRLWEAEDELGTSIVHCCRCYAYTSRIFGGKINILKGKCAGGVDESRFTQKSRIPSGTHPQHGRGSISPPWPVTESALIRLAEVAPCGVLPQKSTRVPLVGGPVVSYQRDTASLREIVEAVGLKFEVAIAAPVVAKRRVVQDDPVLKPYF
jgi:hypothetical protein